MGVYKILFRPLEEYFFGDEGSFGKFKEISYFMRSRKLPTQTTLFGLLRFLNLEVFRYDTYSDCERKKNNAAIGEESFQINEAIDAQKEKDFGKIKRMGSLFLNEDDIETGVNKIYIPLPRDAKKIMNSDKKKYCSVFQKGKSEVMTIEGEKWIPKGFDVKEGIEEGFISIDSGMDLCEEKFANEEGLEIIDDILLPFNKTGIQINRMPNRGKTSPNTSLFKKEYYRFNQKEGKSYSFGVYAEIDEEADRIKEKLNTITGLGLGKKQFSVKALEVTSFEKNHRLTRDFMIKVDRIFEDHSLKGHLIYFISPAYIESNYLKDCVFFSSGVVINRPIKTNISNSKSIPEFSKSEVLYRMLDAGSVLFVNEHSKKNIICQLNNPALKQVGYNHYYIGGESE